LEYPWANGLKVEQILALYDKAQFNVWPQAETGAPVLKAQHPEFQLWNQGIHARSGAACGESINFARKGQLVLWITNVPGQPPEPAGAA
jgi:nitrite reductase (cytochrome c-552)